jgi:hypothetical protein
MRRSTIVLGVASFALSLSFAQGQSGRQKDIDKQEQDVVKDFSTRLGRIAMQYEQSGAHDKAKAALELILKVSPNDDVAKRTLDRIAREELIENKKVVRVLANQSWQDTGLRVSAGRPVAISAQGQWLFKMSRSVGPEGMEVPDEMRRFPLGALIGIIDPVATVSNEKTEGKREKGSPRPFLVGAQHVLTPQSNGRLFFKIHDTEESDNSGQLTVTISGYVKDQ